MKAINGYVGKICIILSIAFIIMISINWAYIYIACYSKEGINQMPWYATGLILVSLFLGLLGVILEYMNDLINIIESKKSGDLTKKLPSKGKKYIGFYINRIFVAEANVWWMVTLAIILGIGYIWGYFEYNSIKNNGSIMIDIKMWLVMILSLVIIEFVYYKVYKYYVRCKNEVNESNNNDCVTLGTAFFKVDEGNENKVSKSNTNSGKEKKNNYIWNDDKKIIYITIISLFLWIASIIFYRVHYSPEIGLRLWKDDLNGMIWEILSTTGMMMLIGLVQLKCQFKYINYKIWQKGKEK